MRPLLLQQLLRLRIQTVQLEQSRFRCQDGYVCLNAPRQLLGIRKLSGGFTLIETLLATAILVTGLVAVAYLFTYSIRTNMMMEQQTSATLLLYNKMEELRGTSYSSLTAGGGLDASSPTPNYWDYVTIGTSGTITFQMFLQNEGVFQD
jgi:type II secretory pathway pseudopilin PulG